MADETKDTKTNAAATRLPFGLCEAHGITIQKGWTPRDAWEALKKAGVVSKNDPYKEYHEVEAEQATKARFAENMNDTQLDMEIEKTKREIEKAKQQREKLKPSSTEKALSEAFPLGSGGLTRSQADKMTGYMSETALNRGLSLEKAIKDQEYAERRLKALESEKKRRSTPVSTPSASSSQMTWKISQKEQYTNGMYKPQVISSGNFAISGKSGFYTISYKGEKLAIAKSQKEAKALTERFSKLDKYRS